MNPIHNLENSEEYYNKAIAYEYSSKSGKSKNGIGLINNYDNSCTMMEITPVLSWAEFGSNYGPKLEDYKFRVLFPNEFSQNYVSFGMLCDVARGQDLNALIYNTNNVFNAELRGAIFASLGSRDETSILSILPKDVLNEIFKITVQLRVSPNKMQID